MLQRKLQLSMSASQVCVVAQSVCWYLGLRPLAGVCPTLTAAAPLLTLPPPHHTELSWAGETESDPHNILLQRVTVMQRLFLTVTDCYNSIDNWYSSVISDLWPRCKHCNIKLETLSTHSLLQASADCLRRGQRESLSTIDSSCSTFSFSVVISSSLLITQKVDLFIVTKDKKESFFSEQNVVHWKSLEMLPSDISPDWHLQIAALRIFKTRI